MSKSSNITFERVLVLLVNPGRLFRRCVPFRISLFILLLTKKLGLPLRTGTF